jgi:pyridoxine 5-phosphate synthase
VNLELAAASDVLRIAIELHPMAATLVPERREEITTEGGLQVAGNSAVAHAVKELRAANIRTSLFIAPEEDAVRASADLGVDAIELHTGEFANAYMQMHRSKREAVLHEVERLRHAAELGRSLGLAIHAGHGLTYENVAMVAAIPEVEELNIGHSIVSRAVFSGMERAVRSMKEIIIMARAHAYTA